MSNIYVDCWSDPSGCLSAIFAPSVPVSGNPVKGVDSISSGAVRAYGVDPVTGGLIAPQYQGAATAAGWDSNDPMGFVNRVSQDAVSYYNRQLSQNEQSAGSGQNFFAFALIAVLAFFLIKAVK